MRRRSRSRTGSGSVREKRAKQPSPTEVVALVNGVTASIGGVYVLTSSALVAALAGVLALVVAGLFFVGGR
ncbi:hypothetical protein [Streptomyces sp. NPDC050485]|uniref:hypothetical protein n=1 Tax=Streptomyces sp. NPDC050485 TaxID=3365617 RepID=UPI00378A0512